MEGGQLDRWFLWFFSFPAAAAQQAGVVGRPLAAVEFRGVVVDVFLVDLVGQQDQVVPGTKEHDVADGLPGQDGPGGIPGIDQHEPDHVRSVVLRFPQGPLELCGVEVPLVFFVQKVPDLPAAQQIDRGAVDRILGRRDHDAARFVGDHRRQQVGDRRAGAVAQEDVLRIGRDLPAVPSLQKRHDVLPEGPRPLAVAVGPAPVPPEGGLDLPRPLDGVRRKQRHRGGVVDPGRVREVHQGRDLAGPREGLLADRLGVPDVGVDDLVEGPLPGLVAVAVVGVVAQLVGDLVGGDDDRPADGVFHPPKIGIDGIDGQFFLLVHRWWWWPWRQRGRWRARRRGGGADRRKHRGRCC
mmetsp:Transcript_20976/g.44006  ORF Transcript_20976/g.44006 Transcript_20976/m.44006 type:complete len:353 (-) Transcript_20976:282-1340(-)